MCIRDSCYYDVYSIHQRKVISDLVKFPDWARLVDKPPIHPYSDAVNQSEEMLSYMVQRSYLRFVIFNTSITNAKYLFSDEDPAMLNKEIELLWDDIHKVDLD